jgi:hypothetical protein
VFVANRNVVYLGSPTLDVGTFDVPVAPVGADLAALQTTPEQVARQIDVGSKLLAHRGTLVWAGVGLAGLAAVWLLIAISSPRQT